MDEGIILRHNERGLYMNDVNKDIKELFFQLAKEDHANHYGNCLKWCIEQALEYQKVKEIILNQDFINHILGDKPQIETEEKKPIKQIKMLNGKTIEREEKEK